MAMVGFSQHTPAAGGSAPTFVAVGTAIGTLGEIDLPWPTHQADDVAIAVIESRHNDPALTSPPTGWTNIVANAGSESRLDILWSRATGSSEINLYFADVGRNHACGQIMLFRGCRTGSAPAVTLTTNTAASSTSISIAGGTSSGNNHRIIYAVTSGLDSGTPDLTAGLTNATLTSMTNHVEENTASGGGGGVYAGSGTLATAGSTGTCTGTFGTASAQCHAVVELIP